MENKGFVSIIVPAYNAENCVENFISAILAQTYSNWELIVVDDGSDDKTVSILKEFELKDSRIRIYERDRKPKGSVTCRNIGQTKSTGEYLIHFDIDDLVESWCLEQRVRFMDKNPGISYATFRGESVSINSLGKVEKIGHKWGEKPQKDLLTCFLTVKYPFSTWNNIYRASIFKEIYWDENVKIYTDFSYIVPIILNGYSHAFDEESRADYLYYVGQISNAMTSNFVSDQKYESTKYLFDKTMSQLEKSYRFGYYKKKFKTYFVLQYERLLTNGSLEQIEDYCEFYEKYYGKDFRIKLIYAFLKGKIKTGRSENFRRRVRLYVYSLYHPKDVFKWLVMKHL